MTAAAPSQTPPDANDYFDVSFPLETPTQRECLSLFRAKQYKSAEILARFDLSVCERRNRSPHFAIAILGECALAQQQYAHAKQFFQQLYAYDEATYRYKEACCLEKLNSPVEATSVLEGIRAEERTFAVNIMLGELYTASNHTALATKALLVALQQNPYALEAAEMLARLKADKQAILTAMEDGLQARGGNHDAEEWAHYRDLVTAFVHKRRFQTSHALQILSKLENAYPRNVYILNQIANLYFSASDVLNSVQVFERIRSMESTQMQDMDKYAHLLARGHRIGDLNELVDALLAIDDKRPEAWTALAVYFEALEDHSKATAFLDKAIQLDQRHAFAFRIRGAMLMTDRLGAEHASVAFFRSNMIEEDIANFEGLVDAYLISKKMKEAIATAKEALTLAPTDPRTYTLVGLALIEGNNKDQGKRMLKRALAINASELRPLFSLVDLYITDKIYEEAIEALKEGLEGTSTAEDALFGKDMLWSRLGDVLSLSERYSEAVEAYHRALGLNPQLLGAQESLERLEKLIRGQDLEDDEMNEQ